MMNDNNRGVKFTTETVNAPDETTHVFLEVFVAVEAARERVDNHERG